MLRFLKTSEDIKQKTNLVVLFYFFQSIILLVSYFLSTRIDQFGLIDQLTILSKCFIYFFIEQALFLVLLLFLYRKGFWMNGFTVLLILLFYIIQGVQFLSFTMYSDFLIKDALANFEHIGLLLNIDVILLLVFFILMGFVCVWIFNSCKVRNWGLKKRFSGAKLTAFLYGIPFVIALLLQSFVNLKQEPNFPLADESRSPVAAYITTTYDFLFTKEIQSAELDKKILDSYSPHIDINQQYPLIKKWFYKDSLPFKKVKSTNHLNVIVFFVESLSSRNLGVYNDKLKNISPNINSFSDSCLVIRDYYNHTAATYRGIQGQLCSMFPYYGGKDGWDLEANTSKLTETNVLSIPELLKPLGYTSVFIGSENEKIGGLDDMALKLLSFDSVFCQDKIISQIGDKALLGHGNTLSDHQLMKGLIDYLDKNNNQNKFFLSVYNLGTHAWFESPDTGVKYKDGSIPIYNVVHNFDNAFGVFWEYFKKSPYYDNTIVILTADHCYPPVEEFVALAGEDYSPYFVDRIPYIVYDPFHDLPNEYSTTIRTSLDFAPTLLHLMEIPNDQNPYLGTSLFDKSFTRPDQFAAIGDVPYLITDGGVIAKPKEFELVRKYVNIRSYINYLQFQELNNKVWAEKIP